MLKYKRIYQGVLKMSEIQNNHKLKNQEKWIYLERKELKHIFIYYSIVLFISFSWLCISLILNYEIFKSGFSKLIGILMFDFPSGILGATIYYIRKLYKSAIQNLVTDSSIPLENTYYRKLGAKIYFYSRPIISGILSIIINLGIISGLFFVNTGKGIDNNNFFLVSLIISFFIGYSNGKLILKLDSYSENVINNIIKENNNNEK